MFTTCVIQPFKPAGFGMLTQIELLNITVGGKSYLRPFEVGVEIVNVRF